MLINSKQFLKRIFIFFIFLSFLQLVGSNPISKDTKDKSNKGKEVKVNKDKAEAKVKEPKIKVSVIIPVYNTSKYIERCLKSALNQTLKEIEIITINDNSSDDSLEILKQFEEDKRLKILTINQNQGAGVARNIGIELAQGEFIGFIDSDDYVDERFYEFLYKYSKDKYSHHRKLYGYGAPVDSIWKKSFLDKYHIRFPVGHEVGEDVKFRKAFMRMKPKKIETPDEGIYYYYKRREGSSMNYKSDYIKNLSESNSEGVEKNNSTIIGIEETNSNMMDMKKEDAPSEGHFIKWMVVIGVSLSVVTGIVALSIFLYKRKRYNQFDENSMKEKLINDKDVNIEDNI
ncbi:nucleotide-diphospho-sugar transferase [Neocallimastix californiae]|uniref:Nucleotide-diphospho-sugar transferase n=1 Tax=Neocallimastix californiae TaxID=1754190 RepID=A0A1Y2FE05_9FUNG|nr:nucleotide-diphospho-sugar transferase [Neocallimastix californiae]|eukprot:ORY81654.1 nucleotide-diphospho-sugar transferase [Neocallimastix californiae]